MIKKNWIARLVGTEVATYYNPSFRRANETLLKIARRNMNGATGEKLDQLRKLEAMAKSYLKERGV